ncbi:glycosyltransferase [Demequina sp.]|uniref:glycosyltransferase n=1 Tax=Demequina sp. TaxID=2050685 RepID=UPI0025E2DC73|nr:glycosyltransferase [Demequina sp.]
MGTPRVLVLTSTLPAREGDGTPAFVADLSRELGREFEVRVVAPAVPGAPAFERWDDAGVEVVRYRYFPSRWEDLADGAILENVRARRSRGLQVPFLLGGLARELRRQLREFRPDAIHAHWIIPQGIVARRVAGDVPIVVTTLGGDLYALNSGIARTQKSLVVREAAAVTVMNADMRDRAIALGADPARTRIMPMGARLTTVGAQHPPASPASRRHPLRLLAVGRLVEKKGFDVLIEALRRAQARLELEIVGDGPERARLEALAAGLPVTFAGQLPRDELAGRYLAAGVAVFPSRRAASGDQDGLPVAMLEAMGAGCAVIASDLPGLNEAIATGHSGVLVHEGDVDALARSLEVLADDAELRAALGGAARERAASYSVQAVGEGYRELFREVLGR